MKAMSKLIKILVANVIYFLVKEMCFKATGQSRGFVKEANLEEERVKNEPGIQGLANLASGKISGYLIAVSDKQ